MNWLKLNWPWIVLALLGAACGVTYQLHPQVLLAPIAGAPRWAWLATLIGLPLLNEGVRLSKSTAAQSLYQWAIRALLKMFGPLPLIGDLLRFFDQPAPASTSQPPKPPGAAALLPFLLLAGVLSAAGCASAFQQAKLAEGAAARALNTTAIAWIAYDAHHQEDLVARATSKEEAIKMVVDYRNNVQDPVLKALHAAGGALEELDSALAAGAAAQNKDWTTLTAAVTQAVIDLAAVLRRFDVPIPIPQLGGAS